MKNEKENNEREKDLEHAARQGHAELGEGIRDHDDFARVQRSTQHLAHRVLVVKQPRCHANLRGASLEHR
eukprot:gene1712-2372_t